MGIARGIAERRSYEGESGLAKPEGWLMDALGGHQTASGIRVNQETALRASAVYDCVRVISEDIAKLPLITYRRLKPRGKERATEHPLYTLFHDRPNSWMSSFTWRETGQACLLLWGNEYSEIEVTVGGRYVALWPIRPDWVRPEKVRDNRGKPALIYHVRNEKGQEEVLPQERMLHIPGLAFDGLVGRSVIAYQREAIGLYLAAQEFGSRFFGNDTTPGLILTAPRKLKQEEKDALKEDFRVKYEGLSKKFRLGILEQGWDLKTMGMPLQDAQYLELRKFQVLEVSRMFRMPPHKIGSMEAATYSNIEHQGIEYQTDTIEPWVVRREQILNWKLFTESERKTYFCEHLMDGLLRGDTQTRSEANSKMVLSGVYTPNEVRVAENKNPLPGGDQLWMPMNMLPADQAAEGIEPMGERTQKRILTIGEIRSRRGAALRRRLALSYRRVFSDAAARLIKREVNDVAKAANKMLGSRSIEQFEAWLEDFYRELEHVAETMMGPAYQSYAEALLAAASQEIGVEAEMLAEFEAFTRRVIAGFASKHTGSSLGQLKQLLRMALGGVDPQPLIEERLEEWEEKFPKKASERETIRFGGAFSRTFFFASGVTVLVWVASADACPLCMSLDGQTVGQNGYFVRQDDEISAEGAEPIRPSSDVGHPPLHDGCECMIAPG
ncbi:MAG: phage portal protein [Actinomycetota bacterium]|nr:phage portal protein [Actinomycetota bacterium]